MYRQFYQGMTLTHLPLFTLILFIAVFLGVVAWVFLGRRRQDFDALARMPFAEGGGAAPGPGGSDGHA